MKKFLSTSLHVAFIWLITPTAFADVLFNTFGPNDSFDGTGAFNVTWNITVPPGGELGIASAAQFQLGSGIYALNSVTLAMGYTLGTNNLKISIVADNAGQPTGPVIETVVSHPNDI